MAKKIYRIKTEQKAVIYRTYLIEADSLEDAEREIDYEMEDAEGLVEYWDNEEHDCPVTKSMVLIEDQDQCNDEEYGAIFSHYLHKSITREGK